jgi:transposase
MTVLPGQARKGRQNQVTIPEPYEDLASLYRSVLTMKELVETLAGQRGQAYDVAVTWQDLLDLGWIRKEDIPYDLGTHPIQRRG